MRRFLLLMALFGCGSQGGDEEPSWTPPCDVLDETEVGDGAAGVFELAALDGMLGEIVGEFAVVAETELDDEDGSYTGVLRVQRGEGAVIAEDRAHGEYTPEDDDCSDVYVVPLVVELELDGDLFRYEAPITVTLQNGPVALDVTRAADFWHPADEMETTLDTSKKGADALEVGIGASYVDGRWAAHIGLYTETEDAKHVYGFLEAVEP